VAQGVRQGAGCLQGQVDGHWRVVSEVWSAQAALIPVCSSPSQEVRLSLDQGRRREETGRERREGKGEGEGLLAVQRGCRRRLAE